MPFGRLTLHALVLSMLPWTPSCERSRAEVERDSPTIRISAGVATGTFGPFSDALVQGYKQLLPELRIELVDTTGVRPQSSKHWKTGRSISAWRRPASPTWRITAVCPRPTGLFATSAGLPS